jgi:polyisoprenoid-binding protein YceI
MKKALIVIVLIIIVSVGFYVFNKNSVPTNLEQANILEDVAENKIEEKVDLAKIPEIKNFSFTFTGYGPAGKYHDGTFGEYTLSTSSIVFKSASVDTGIEKLNNHLCAPEFFDCVKYPEIKFVATSLTKKSENAYEVAGTLSFKDITKNVLFNANLENNKVTAEFLMDTTEFNFNPKLVENNVKIKFSFDI